jgi:predicted nucleic acid-binding protein
MLELFREKRFEIAISVPLALEYEATLIRHSEELGLSTVDATGLVGFLCATGQRQEIHFLWRPALNDPADEFILELAVAGQCSAIVTHNVRDFGGAKSFDIAVRTPGDFLRSLREVP